MPRWRFLMSPAPATGSIVAWFSYLQQFQDACSFNLLAMAMDPLTFANSTILKVLLSTNQQGQFITAVGVTPGVRVGTADLTAYPTFKGLLNRYYPLTTYIGLYLQALAAAPYPPPGASQDFWNAATSSAFPGGSKDAPWTTLMTGLGPAMLGVCFTAGLQTKAAKTLDTAGSKMIDVITQIAGLG